MAYGSVLADTVQSSTAGTAPTFKDGNGTETGTLCRAWVNFNGTGTVAIRGSFNVSSITDNGTGIYTINFTNALADANYSVNCTVSDDNVAAGGRSGNVMMLSVGTPPTSSALRVFNLFGASSSTTAGYGDVTYACVSVYR